MEAVRFALHYVDQSDDQGKRGGYGEGSAQTPAAAGRIRGEQKWKPDGHREWAEINENQD